MEFEKYVDMTNLFDFPHIEVIDGFDIRVNDVTFKLLRASTARETIFAYMNENLLTDCPWDTRLLEIKHKSRVVVDSEGEILKQHYHDGGLLVSMHKNIKDVLLIDGL